jgi:Mrp family chromosome partitioning ATPase
MDGVVIVGRVGRNRRDVAQRLHQTLPGAGAPLLGVIAKGFKSGRGSYGYSYDYSYTPNKQLPHKPTDGMGSTAPPLLKRRRMCSPPSSE